MIHDCRAKGQIQRPVVTARTSVILHNPHATLVQAKTIQALLVASLLV